MGSMVAYDVDGHSSDVTLPESWAAIPDPAA
jgi:hypothetical protein